MILKRAVIATVILMPLQALAADQESQEVVTAVHRFYQEMTEGQFEEAFSRIKLGAEGYLSQGLIIGIPNETVRAMVIEESKKERGEGAQINLLPKYVKATIHGNVAIATYLLDGTVTESKGDESQRVLERASLIWTKTDDGWKIIHWHISKVEVPENND